MKFDNIQNIREYLVANYPKGKVTMASWRVSDHALAIGVYEGEDLIKGVMTYFDPFREKYVLLDSLHADLAVRNYVKYRNEFDDAIALFELIEETEEIEIIEDELFFDLD